MTAIHQFLPTLAPRDAVGAHTMTLRSLLRDAGYRSEIYALEAKDELRREARDFRTFRGGERSEPTWIVYQLSVGSIVGDFVLARPEPLVVNYHNITPAGLWTRWEPTVAAQLGRGRRQLAALARRASLGLAVSRFNGSELVVAGLAQTAVVPVLVDPHDLDAPPDPATLERLRAARAGGGADWLFVGRLAPSKAQHDVVKAFAAYHRFHDPHARLHLVGGSASHAYEAALRAFVDALGLRDAVELTGSVTSAARAAYYDTADVLVVLSEHEGFCVPALEAMHHRVPVVAYASSALPETVADAGVLLDCKEPCTVAAAVHRVVTDAELRAALTDAGARRVATYDLARTRRALLDTLAPVVGQP